LWSVSSDQDGRVSLRTLPTTVREIAFNMPRFTFMG
jgi:hypothetical protein